MDDRWSNNNVISRQPKWAGLDNRRYVNINNQWNQAIRRPVDPRWGRPSRGRMGYWNGWADGVRHHWNHYHRHNRWFNNNWWQAHYHPVTGWHYHYYYRSYGWTYWWGTPTWGAFNNWFAWTAPASVWSQPIYYDYGAGGNVVYSSDAVTIGGTQVATPQEFAASAMDLATVAPPEDDKQAEEAEWMPLGTFAVSTDEDDTNPSLTVQLAVNKQGIVSGTLYNIETDQAQTLQGRVDPKTQRVAMRFGENEEMVAETGLYNLTQDQAPVLVHFGPNRTQNYLLVRLEKPEAEE